MSGQSWGRLKAKERGQHNLVRNFFRPCVDNLGMERKWEKRGVLIESARILLRGFITR